MTIADIFAETYSALNSNRSRSGLTMLGIVIGIGSVIALMGVGQGATAAVQSNITSLGSNLLIVSPGAARNAGPVSGGSGSAQTLTVADAAALKTGVTGAKAIAMELSRRYQILYKGNNTNTQVVGTEPAYTEIRNVTVDQGVFFTDQQVQSRERVAVLGPTTSDTLFGVGVSPLGQMIKINRVQFKVIGVTQSKGGSGLTNSDDVVYVPVTAAQQYLAGQTTISNIDVAATDANSISAAQQEITDILLARHHITDPLSADFSVLNQADIISSLSSVTNVLTLLLGAIAGISLLVGGIGIMNMMLTSVTERTREIGLRKAIGAKNWDITVQFLAEAVTLTLIGGLIGTLLGWGVATLVTSLGIVTSKVTASSVLLAFGVSALVGIIFGYYPARRAAALKPIEALRYE